MSSCFNALQLISGWNPGPAAAGPIKVIIGLRTNMPLKFSTILIQGNHIVLHGSLENSIEVTQFKSRVTAKVNGSPPLQDLDRRSLRIVVPCPPPRFALNQNELTRLDTAINVPGTDLAIVFT